MTDPNCPWCGGDGLVTEAIIDKDDGWTVSYDTVHRCPECNDGTWIQGKPEKGEDFDWIEP